MSRIGTAATSGAARVGAAALALALFATLTDPARAVLEEDKPGRDAPAVQRTTPAKGKSVTGKAPVIRPVADPAPRTTWPQPGQRQVTVPEADAGADTSSKTQEDAKNSDAPTPPGPAFTRAGDWPVWVGDPDSKAARKTGAPAARGRRAPAAVTVAVADRSSSEAAGIPGLLVHVRPAGASSAGPVAVRVKYTDFAGAYGGGWGQRLRAFVYPACVLTTPEQPQCTAGRPLPTTNDADAGTVTAVLDLAGPDAGGDPVTPEGTVADPAAGHVNSGTLSARTPRTDARSAATGEGAVFAVQAEAAAETDDWAATPLSESATWTAGGQSGAAMWSHPFPAPPVPGGLVPRVVLGYNSQAVDGRTSGRNNQASWVGDGFDLAPGFIERKYRPCIDDQGLQGGQAPNNPAVGEPGGVAPTGDLCWKSLNATLSFGGGTSEIVYDEAKQYWRKVFDDGTRITRHTGAENGDDNGEYWVVSTPDGLAYYFGAENLSTAAGIDTDSTWTVPVYGNHPGEPGYQGGDFAGSYRQQAWRWNLDHVRDLTGNAATYVWTAENNHYNRGTDYDHDSAGTRTQYQRGGFLTRIDYGLRVQGAPAGGAVADPGNPLAQVAFTVAERCRVPDDPGATCVAGDITEHKEWWGDLPADQLCSAGGTCLNNVATFFTRKRLNEVTTRSRPSVGGALQDVDRWVFTYTNRGVLFPATLTRTALGNTTNTHGHDDVDVTRPPIQFDSVAMENRIDTIGDGASGLSRHRLTTVVDETGGQVAFTYKAPECTAAIKDVNPWQNTSLCFPAKYTPPGQPYDEDAKPHWFHKYVVREVIRSDNSGFAAALGGASARVVTRYSFDGAAWAYDRTPFVRTEDRTWNDWRGFRTVTTTVGEGGEGTQTQQRTRTTYYQGMWHDRKNASSDDRRHTTFDDTENTGIEDHWRLAGTVRETQVFNGLIDPADVRANEVSATITVPWLSDPGAAQRTPSFAAPATVHGRTTITGQAEPRRTKATFTYDAYGFLTVNQNLGDLATAVGPADDLCTALTYARPSLGKDGPWILDRVAIARTLSRADCTSSAGIAAALVSETRSFYDGATTPTAAPTRGLVTRTEQVETSTGYGTPAEQVVTGEASYDAYGRALTSTDALGRVTTTAYTPATGPVTAVTVTSPDPDGAGLGGGPQAPHVSTTVLDPRRGLTLAATDPAGVSTRGAYDALGRLVGVWRNNRAVTANLAGADVQYAYDDTAAGPEAVTTRTRLDDDLGVRTVLSSIVLHDDLRRPVQTQTPGREEEGDLRDGRVVTSTGYDTRGLPVIATAPAFTTGAPTGEAYWAATSAPPAITTTVYDGVGRPTQETFAAGPEEDPDITWDTETEYRGDRVVVTPPDGAVKTTTISDARGRTAALIQHGEGSDSRRTDYTWTPAGQLASMTDPGTAPGVGRNTWTWSYDLMGRQLIAADPDAGTTTRTYTKTGQLASVTDARGQVLTYSYDNLDRQRVRYAGSEAPGNKLAEWTYDPVIAGNPRPGLPDASIRYINDGTGGTGGTGLKQVVQQVTGYDALARPTEVTTTIPEVADLIPEALAGTYVTGSAYNGDGSLASTTLGGYGPSFARIESEKLRHFYDEYGRPQALAGAGAYVADTVRNAFGEVLRYSYGNTFRREVWQRFTYQPGTRRLNQTRIDREIDASALETLTYGYDPAGNPTTIATAGLLGTETRCFDYDAYRQLTAAWTPSAGGCAAAPDPSANPSPALGGIAPYGFSWTFDRLGNRTSETRYANGAAPATTTYSYAGTLAEPAPEPDPGPHQLTGLDGARSGAFAYDPAGNTTTRTLNGTTQNLDWDIEGRLEKVTGTGGELARHLYTADGQRLIKRDPTGTTLYLGDTEITVNSAATAGSWQRHYALGGQSVAVRYGNKMTDADILLTDPQNTAQHAIKTASSQVTSRRTLPYGAGRSTNGPTGIDPPAGWASTRGFVGSTTDTATDLLRVGARDYDPTLGRFLSVDPILDPADPIQVNPYGYADNNPISFADPTGMIAWDCGADPWCGMQGLTTGNPISPEPAQAAPVSKSRSRFGLPSVGDVLGAAGGFAKDAYSPGVDQLGEIAAGVGSAGTQLLDLGVNAAATQIENAACAVTGSSQYLNLCGVAIPELDTTGALYGFFHGTQGSAGSTIGQVGSLALGGAGAIRAGAGAVARAGSAWRASKAAETATRVAPGLPKALTGGTADVHVYFGVRDGKNVYAGITNNLKRRQAQHGDRFALDPLTTSPVTRGEARAIEQALMVRNPGFENVRNSISPAHSYYDDAVRWGEDWLTRNGY